MATAPRPGDGITRLAPQDAEFVYEDSDRYNSNSTGVYFFDTTAESVPWTHTDAVDWIRDRLGHSDLFHRRLRRVPFELDYPYWVPDSSFDPADHVHVEPADGPGWDVLRRQVSRIAGQRIDLDRPPWALHFVTGVSGIEGLPERMTVVVWRSHHAAGDGMSSRDLCMRLFGDAPAPAGEVAATTWSPADALVRALRTVPAQWRTFRRGLEATGDAARRVAALVESGDLVAPSGSRPATRFNRSITPDLTFDVVSIDPADIRAVQAAVEGVTFNDVMLSTIAGALAAYLAEHDETPAASLAAMVPMSLRTTLRGAAGRPDDRKSNHLAIMAVDLHTDITDPLDRLRAIHRSTRHEKTYQRHEDVRSAARRVETSPAWLLHLAGRLRVRRTLDGPTVERYNTMISNIPWTGGDLRLGGAPLVWSFGLLGIVDGGGLRHLIISRDSNEVELSFCTDTAMMPDTGRYRALLDESFRQLVAAVEESRESIRKR